MSVFTSGKGPVERGPNLNILSLTSLYFDPCATYTNAEDVGKIERSPKATEIQKPAWSVVSQIAVRPTMTIYTK